MGAPHRIRTGPTAFADHTAAIGRLRRVAVDETVVPARSTKWRRAVVAACEALERLLAADMQAELAGERAPPARRRRATAA